MPDEDLHAEPHSAERQSFLKLTRELASFPLDQSSAALETAAAIAGVSSLRAGIEYLRAAPAAREVLQAAELRSWGEMGRQVAMTEVETAVTFFSEGVDATRRTIPDAVFRSFFQLCSRQIALSSSHRNRNAPQNARARSQQWPRRISDQALWMSLPKSRAAPRNTAPSSSTTLLK